MTPQPTRLQDDGEVAVLPTGTYEDTDNERHVRRWRVQVYFHAGGDRETYELGPDAWTGAVKGNLVAIKASDPNNPVVLASDVELELSQSSPEAVYLSSYLAPELHPYHNNPSADRYTQIRFELDATDGYTPSATAAVNLQFRLTLSLEETFVHHFDANPSEDDRLHCDVAGGTFITSPEFSCNPSASPDKRSVKVTGTNVTLQWTAPPDHPGATYDFVQIEIVRLHNTSLANANVGYKVEALVDWNTALRYEVAIDKSERSTSGSITIIPHQGTGYYLFRVRPVTSRYDGRTSHLMNYGPWSPSPDQGAQITIEACINDYSVHALAPYRNIASFWYQEPDQSKPFVHQMAILRDTSRTSFVSDSRVYLNAIGQTIQTQSLSRGDLATLITQNPPPPHPIVIGSQVVYDLEGRASLATIPSPLLASGGSDWKQSIEFVPQAVTTTGGSLYGPEHFDDLGTNLNNPETVSPSSPLAWYNSNNNPDLTIPSSGGYPYARTVYKADGSVLAVVPPGLQMRPPGSLSSTPTADMTERSTRTYQSSVSQRELTSIFGDEAPVGDRIVKMLTVSPDGVASASYYDGPRVIATCLVDAGELAGNTSVNAAGKTVISNDGNAALLNLNGLAPVDSPTKEVVNTLSGVTTSFTGGILTGTRQVIGSMKIALAAPTQCTITVTRKDGAGATIQLGSCTTHCEECVKYVRVRVSRVDVLPVQIVDERVIDMTPAKVCSTEMNNTQTYTLSLGVGEYVVERISELDRLDPNGRRHVENVVDALLPESAVQQGLATLLGESLLVPGNPNPTLEQVTEHYKLYRSGEIGEPPLVVDGKRTVAIGTNGTCVTVALPELVECYPCLTQEEIDDPLLDPAKVGFEEYAKDQLIRSGLQLPGGIEARYNNFYFYWDAAGVVYLSKYPNQNPDSKLFDRMVLAMLRDETCTYNCRELWVIWKTLVDARIADIRSNPTYLGDNRSRAIPDIVEKFLSLAGYCWAQANVPDNNNTIDNVAEAEIAYKHLRALNQARLTTCLTTFDANDPDYWDYVSDCVLSDYTAKDKEHVEDSTGAAAPKTTGAIGLHTAFKLIVTAMECMQHCEQLREEFRKSIVAAALPATLSPGQLHCMVEAAVQECSTACAPGTEQDPAQMRTNWMQRMRTRMTGYHSIQLPTTEYQCNEGYQLVTNTSKLIDLLITYLNAEYQKLQQTSTSERCINFAPLVYQFLLSYMSDASIPHCIKKEAFNDSVPPTLLGIDTGESECDDAENQTPANYRRWTFRVIPGVDGLFFRPKDEHGCELCALSFTGPRARQNIHPWVAELNTMVDTLWGAQLIGQHTEQAATRYLKNGDSLQTYRAEIKNVIYQSSWSTNIDTAFAEVLSSSLNDLYLNSVGVNGSVQPFVGFLRVEQPIVPGTNPGRGLCMLSAFDGFNYSYRDSSDTVYQPWRSFGHLMFDFGSIGDSVSTFARNLAFGWQLLPSIGDSLALGSISLLKTVAGEAQTETFASSEEASELLHFLNAPFTQLIGHFEQNPQRRLVFVDASTQKKYPIESVRFHETYTRTNIMGPTVDSCSANAICPIVPSCAICIKWDTLAVEDYDDVDPYVAPPCEQQKLDQIKAEITARYMKEIQKLRQSIILSYAVKCLNAGNVVDKVEASYDQKLYHYTLYYYDRAGRLVRTVSPKGVDINPTRTVSATPAHTFISRFRTDSRGRMLVKTVPDGGSERYEYDKYGRLRFIVDAVQNAAASKRMSYFKYDALDRVVETGEVMGLGDEQGLETAIHYNRDDATWPTAADYDRNDVAVYVYDYPANTTAGNSAESGWTHVSSTSGLVQRNVRHRLSWAYAVPHWPEDESFASLSNVVRTFFTYDAQGNATAVVNDIPHSDQSSPNGTARLVKRTDYRYDHSTGAPLAVDYQVHGVDNDDDRFQHRYEYDANGRLKIVETSRNGVMWDRDVVYDYNLDGSLRRETIGEDSLQGRDFTYTLLGQLKGINHPTLDPAKDPGADGTGTGKHAHVGKDAFGMSFHYHEEDFERSFNTATSPFNDSDPAMLGVPQSNGVAPNNSYAGLMGAWSYRTQATGDQQVLRDGALLGERFQHDRIGRLRSDTTYSFDGTNWISDGNGGWGTRYVLDQNSNMVHIKRWAMTGSTMSVLYDDATLNLAGIQSNKLVAIEDAAGDGISGYEQELTNAVTGNIETDAKGRLVEQQLDNDASATQYTSYDVPKSLTRSMSVVNHVRDPFGNIVRADVHNNNEWSRASIIVPADEHADRVVYNLTDLESEPSVQEWSIFGGLCLGVRRSTTMGSGTGNFYRVVGSVRYQLVDHLGSIRAIISDVLSLENNEPAVGLLASIDYEPYGAMQSRRYVTPQDEPNYRYAFQGMRLTEGEFGLAEYLTPFRMYDAKTGRWSGQDPIRQPWTNPYEGMASSPTVNTDVFGLRPTRKEMMAMQNALYKGKYDQLLGGWQPEDKFFIELTWDNAGFQSMLFKRNNPISGKLEYAYVTRGSEECQDWAENLIRHPLGLRGQYDFSVEQAVKLSNRLGPDIELTLGGHSLGGALAMANAIATGRGAIVVNPAGLFMHDFKRLGLDRTRLKSVDIDVIRVQGEAVAFVQRLANLFLPVIDPMLYQITPGEITELSYDYEYSWVGTDAWIEQAAIRVGLHMLDAAISIFGDNLRTNPKMSPSSPVVVTASRDDPMPQPEAANNGGSGGILSADP
ncbi:MAG: hypothetical protein QY319_08975 [Candidatus Kapaibacterium sp.]|nr:hypothetical protein [Candidatus Kapabacteria bacterium]MBZ0194827.1 hypothetical protein [Candidatus Kapabacteria bacterium]MCC6331116.1 hypothetical protein [Ignavibacteria bacterium]WKZ77266.1 MAG: hypothetical protein QY319_08975 [Candidatus Kapabacteria bacterium]